MGQVSYASEISTAKSLLAGLKANIGILYQKGIDVVFLTKLQELYIEAMKLDNEQEVLRSRLKEKTVILDRKVDEMHFLCNEAMRIVKMDMPPESWKEFGIQDMG